METLLIYGIKSSGLIGMFYLAYTILLRKETFFNSNRWFLLSGLISSVVLPLLVFKKIVWVDPSPTAFDWSKIPMTAPVESETFEINWYFVFAIVYSIGMLVFLMKFTFDFYSLSKILKGKTIQQQADFKFIDVNENIAPFSYFNSIVYNSSLYSATELENILEHEKVHSSQNHTIDVLISRLFCIVFWLNPLVWLYKNAIVQNLEFIADNEASKNISDKKAYQLTLLKITTQENCVAITNHFYQSLIKKRIVMLNKNQSNKRNSWKYAVILPFLIAFTLLFQIETVAQTKENKVEEATYSVSSIFSSILTKNTTNQEIKELEKTFSDEKQKLKISNVKRNINNEIIAIKLEFDYGKTYNRVLERKSEKPINNIKIYINSDEKDDLAYGFEDVDITPIDVVLIEEKKPNESKIAVETQFSESDSYNHITAINNNKEINAKKALILFDGNEISYHDLDKIDVKTISSSGSTVASHAVKKYGDKGKNGVIFINTKNYDSEHFPYLREMREKENNKSSKNAVLNITSANGTNYHLEKEKTEVFTISTINQSADNFDNKKISKLKPMIILNGKKTEANFDISNIDANQIETINVLKGQKAIEKYGKEAENGVIEISTKENANGLEMHPTKSKKESELDKGEIKNSGYETVSSYKQWLNTYKTLWQARISLERMKKQKEKAKIALNSKLFS
jgi:hypothetical protein